MRKPARRSNDRKRDRRDFRKKKVCRFCNDSSLRIDYKNYRLLRSFLTERGRIIPRRISGNCAKHQRELTRAIKQARQVALLPFTALPR
jgi:small subunit ribosomal protein S18